MTKPSTTQRLEFPGYSGPILAARLELPAGPVRAYALFAHCFTCSKDLMAVKVFMGELVSIKAGTRTFSPLMGAEINARGKAPFATSLHAEML